MAISLGSLNRLSSNLPPRLVIYGPPKIGKTSLAAEFPSPVFLMTEDGTPAGLDIIGQRVNSFTELMAWLEALGTQEHTFQTVVLDNLSDIQRFVYDETCARGDDKGNKKSRIEDFGYGKGYVYALSVWQELLDCLNWLRGERKLGFILLAHSTVTRFDDPETVSYSRYQLDIHDKAATLIHKSVDAILMVKRDITIKEEDKGFNAKRAVAAGGNHPWICCEDRAAFLAGNRLGLPARVLYKRGEGFSALAPYFPAWQPEQERKAA